MEKVSLPQPSDLNRLALGLIEESRKEFPTLQIDSIPLPNGGEVFNFAVGRTGTEEAGVLLAKICLAGLADVRVESPASASLSLPSIQVNTDHPLLACIGSQYAGWNFSVEKYFAMCSGPGRLLRNKEQFLQEYKLNAKSDCAVGVFESNVLPGSAEVTAFAEQCKLDPGQTKLCVACTASIPGSLQVVARSIETAMHKLHELGFDLRSITKASGCAPLPPTANDDLTALGWTNDAVLYGGDVKLFVNCDESEIESIGPRVPSSSSSDFGTPFLETFEKYDRDFYKIDKLLFSPARVVFVSQETGKEFSFGEIREDILKNSFQLE